MTIAPVNPTIAVGQRQPFTVTGAVAPVNVSGGGEYTCAAMSDGTARCAGRNQFGQLGDGSWTNQSLPVAPGGLVSVARAVAGDEFSCALLSDGTAKCWGLGEKGQRGDGTFDQIALTPVAVQGVHNAIALSAGYNHACALLGDRTLRCWGSNANGQLGDPSTPGSAVPIPVPGLGGVQAIAAGSSHTCALVADGSLRCWGDGYLGQLGDGTDTPSTAPVAVSGIGSAVEIVAGWAHTCARLADGGARCWGEGTAGQLGNGATRSSTTPVPVAGIATAVGLTAGWWHHSCALLAGGDVRCWGGNDWGQFGNGTTAASATPVSMTGLAVTWTSSDTTIVSIDTAGQATGLKPGVVTVTARDIGGASASTTLAVQPARHTLTVTKTGSAQGFASVTSTPAGISCDSTCAAEFDAGTVVTLVASPGPLLMSWAGCDSASGNSCTVTMSAARSVTARFVGMQP